jgi:glycosyltransferase involved in cell wall biosynthesis
MQAGMKFLLYSDGLWLPGGVRSYMLALSDLLKSREHEPLLVSCLPGSSERKDGITWISETKNWYLRKLKHNLNNRRMQTRIISVAEQFGPDIVVLNKIDTYTRATVRAFQKYPTIWIAHDYGVVCPTSWGVKKATREVCRCGAASHCYRDGCISRLAFHAYYNPWYKWLLNPGQQLFDLIVAPSQSLANRMLDNGFEGVKVLPALVVHPPPSHTSDVSERVKHIVFAGELADHKGIMEFLQAVQSTKGEIFAKGYSVEIYGDGALRQKIAAFIEQEKLSSLVHLHGVVSHAALLKVFQESRIVVFPSVGCESFGLVALEAMAAGCLLISTDRGALGSIIEDGEEAMVIDPTNPRVFSSAIVRAISLNKGDATRMALRARMTASKHSEESYLKAFEDLCRQALAAHRNR